MNHATEPISRATITTSWGERLEVTDLAPGASAVTRLNVKGDGDWRVDVEFRSGNRLTTEGMYVTSGVDFEDQITVDSSSIDIDHKIVSK